MKTSVSVIIPVYNVEDYLEECLKSVVNQTLNDIEIIVINDGSTDNGFKIIERYQNNYNNIRVIDKGNEGLGVTRNMGVEMANGEYIAFLDSDDYIDINMYKSLYEVGKKNNADVVQCGVEMFYEDSNKIDYVMYDIHNKIEKCSRTDALRRFYKNEIRGYVCNKIIKRDLLIKNNIKFPKNIYYDDMYITIQCLALANEIVLVNESFYKYRQREGSISNCIKEKHIKDYISQVFKCIEYSYKEVNDPFIYDDIKSYHIRSFLCAIVLYIKLFNYDRNLIYKNYNMYFKNIDVKLRIIDILRLNNLEYNYKFIYLIWKFKLLDKYIAMRTLN